MLRYFHFLNAKHMVQMNRKNVQRNAVAYFAGLFPRNGEFFEDRCFLRPVSIMPTLSLIGPICVHAEWFYHEFVTNELPHYDKSRSGYSIKERSF